MSFVENLFPFFFNCGVQVAPFLLYCIAFVNSNVFLVGGTVLPVVLQLIS